MILDDFYAQSGSATSLLRTFIGLSLRRLGGWISVADAVRLMSVVEASSAHARTAVLWVERKSLLLSESQAHRIGYRLNPDAVAMLERGDGRIFTFRQMAGGVCCRFRYPRPSAIPETQRDARYQLRRWLGWMGCGTVATGL